MRHPNCVRRIAAGLLVFSLSLSARAAEGGPPADASRSARSLPATFSGTMEMIDEALKTIEAGGEAQPDQAGSLASLASHLRRVRAESRQRLLGEAPQRLARIPGRERLLSSLQSAQDGIDRKTEAFLELLSRVQAASDQERPLVASEARRFIATNQYRRPARLIGDNNFIPRPLTGVVSGPAGHTPGAQAGRFQLPPNEPGATAPGPQHLSEGVESVITPEIRREVELLGKDPARIREFLINEIEYLPYFGVIQGAHHTLMTRSGNDFDIAALACAMYRAAGYPARYVYGVAEMDATQFANWLQMEDPFQAVLLATEGGGIPVSAIYRGDQIVRVELEHVWAEAHIPYGPFQGSAMDSRIESQRQWVAIDGSFKQHDFADAKDTFLRIPEAALDFDVLSYVDDPTTESSPPYAYQIDRVTGLVQNLTGDTLSSFLNAYRFGAIRREDLGYIPASQQYRVEAVLSRFAHVPPGLQMRITMTMEPGGLNLTKSLPQIANQRINFTYEPATDQDRRIIESYGGIYATPPFLVNVVPVLLLDDQPVARGTAIRMGTDHKLDVRFDFPGDIFSDVAHHNVTAGEFYGLYIQAQRTPALTLADWGQLVESAAARGGGALNSDSSWASVNPTLASRLLQAAAAAYWYEVENSQRQIDGVLWVRSIKQASEALLSLDVAVDHHMDVPASVRVSSIGIDVGRDVYAPYAVLPNRPQARRQYMELAGANASFYEERILTEKFQLPAVSTVSLFRRARRAGIPIHTINADNIGSIRSQLNLPPEILDEIERSINLGKEVIVASRPVPAGDFTLASLVIRDRENHAGGWLISNLSAGGGVIRDISGLNVYYTNPSEFKKRASVISGGAIQDKINAFINDLALLGNAAASAYSGIALNLVEFQFHLAAEISARVLASNGFLVFAPNVHHLVTKQEADDRILAALNFADSGVFVYVGHGVNWSLSPGVDWRPPHTLISIDAAYILPLAAHPKMAVLMSCHSARPINQTNDPALSDAFRAEAFIGPTTYVPAIDPPIFSWNFFRAFCAGIPVDGEGISALKFANQSLPSAMLFNPAMFKVIGDRNFTIDDIR